MSIIDQALKANELYAERYDPKWGAGPPKPKIVVVACMTTSPPRISAARRNAEALLDRATKKEEGFKLELRREQEEMASKTARLRALRLAQEEADQKVAAMQPDRPTKTRRSKQK